MSEPSRTCQRCGEEDLVDTSLYCADCRAIVELDQELHERLMGVLIGRRFNFFAYSNVRLEIVSVNRGCEIVSVNGQGEAKLESPETTFLLSLAQLLGMLDSGMAVENQYLPHLRPLVDIVPAATEGL